MNDLQFPIEYKRKTNMYICCYTWNQWQLLKHVQMREREANNSDDIWEFSENEVEQMGTRTINTIIEYFHVWKNFFP